MQLMVRECKPVSARLPSSAGIWRLRRSRSGFHGLASETSHDVHATERAQDMHMDLGTPAQTNRVRDRSQ